MTPDNRLIDDLAQAVLDGETVDWAAAAETASDDGGHLVEQLKVVAAVGEVLRDGGRPEAARPATERSALDHLESWGHLRISERIGEGAFGGGVPRLGYAAGTRGRAQAHADRGWHSPNNSILGSSTKDSCLPACGTPTLSPFTVPITLLTTSAYGWSSSRAERSRNCCALARCSSRPRSRESVASLAGPLRRFTPPGCSTATSRPRT